MDRGYQLHEIILKYREELRKKIELREQEMKSDENEHYLLYHTLGFTSEEGYQIDYQQNVGRILYNYSGTLLEKLTIECFKIAFPETKVKVMLKNTIDSSPKNVEIDCLVGNKAYEIKWRDATTDGDHIAKEHKRVKIIKDAGYIPVRIMFFNPNRTQAIKIQANLRRFYQSEGGEYYSGDEAWNYLKNETGVDLKKTLIQSKE